MSFPAFDISGAIGFLTPFGPRRVNEVPLDVVLRESVEDTIIITDHPIEVGTAVGVQTGVIADHAYPAPLLYTMRGGVSNDPISWRAFVDFYPNSDAATRSRAAYDLLRRHARERVPFTLKTPMGDFDNMIFQSLKWERDADTSHALLFSATLREVQLVIPDPIRLEVTEDQMRGEQAKSSGTPAVQRGATAVSEVESGTPLNSAYEFIRGLLP